MPSTDSTEALSGPLDSVNNVKTLPVSKDKLESTVTYEATDSIVYDAKNKLLYLHKGAKIGYEDIKINADYMLYEQDSNRLNAFQIDSIQNSKDTSVLPSRLAQGNESSTFTSLFYNFKSRRALVENAYSQYGEGFILSNQVKRNNDNSINGYRNIYTTCNDPHPHFGIGAKKIKIIPNKVAVAGSANLIIEDIPTPLYLPFGLFPLKQGQRSGFILPTYAITESLGFGLVGGGYYFAINDHYNLQVLSNIYSLGSWQIGAKSDYIYRYRFNGGFAVDFAYNKIGEPYESGNQNSRDFAIRWNHAINPQVLLNSSFSANVNIRSTKYNTFNSRDVTTLLNNNLSSNISYSKTWKGKPFSFNAALRHNQNTQTRLYNITLPELNFNVNQIYPFQLRKDIVTPTWYEKISASYNIRAVNTLDFYDTSFQIKNLKGNDFRNGIEQSANLNAAYSVLKFFNLGFGADYREYWYTQKFLKSYDFQENELATDTMRGFYTARNYNFSTTFSTRIYGVKLFKKGFVRGIRHVLIPSLNANYHPDFGKQYYYRTFSSAEYDVSRYSYFAGSIIGTPPDGREGSIGFSMGNTLQLKVRNKKDTAQGVRKVNLIDGLDIRGGYNIAADSLNWSSLLIGYRTTLLDNIQISGDMAYSPYGINKTNGKIIDEFYYHTDKKILRFQSAGIALTGSFPFKKNNQTLANASEEQRTAIGRNYDAYADFNVPWNLSLNYNIRFRKDYLPKQQKDTVQINQDLNFFGDVNLTPKWKIGFRSGYDFKAKQLNLTSFDIYRDLHCWEMRLNLTPFGTYKGYNFSLNVKSAVLQDLKLVRRKDFRDFL